MVPLPDLQVQEFHDDGKGHCKIDVSFFDVCTDRFSDQHHANQNQEAQCQHLQCRVGFDKSADRAGEEHHHGDGYNNGQYHDR